MALGAQRSLETSPHRMWAQLQQSKSTMNVACPQIRKTQNREVECHNIIHIHISVHWDWQYYAGNSPYSISMCGIFYRILPVPQNIVTNLNNVRVKKIYELENNSQRGG